MSQDEGSVSSTNLQCGKMLTAEQQKLIDLVIERAEQACRYALKHQDFLDADPNYVSGWEIASSVCEGAIRSAVMKYIEEDIQS
jgi:hypothetical protein